MRIQQLLDLLAWLLPSILGLVVIGPWVVSALLSRWRDIRIEREMRRAFRIKFARIRWISLIMFDFVSNLWLSILRQQGLSNRKG